MISKVGLSLKILIIGPHHQLNNCSKKLKTDSKTSYTRSGRVFFSQKSLKLRFVFIVGVSGKPNVQPTCVSPQANTTLVQCGFTSVVFLPSISTRQQGRYWMKWTWWKRNCPPRRWSVTHLAGRSVFFNEREREGRREITDRHISNI